MTEEERIFSGGLFSSEEPELVEKKPRAHRLSRAFNALYEEDEQARQAILRQLLGEVGEGTLPVAACIEAGLAGGSEYFLVEQDDTYGRDPFESLKISHDNLVKLGYGEWF